MNLATDPAAVERIDPFRTQQGGLEVGADHLVRQHARVAEVAKQRHGLALGEACAREMGALQRRAEYLLKRIVAGPVDQRKDLRRGQLSCMSQLVGTSDDRREGFLAANTDQSLRADRHSVCK